MGDIRANHHRAHQPVQQTQVNQVQLSTSKQEINIQNNGNLTINIAEGDQVNITGQTAAAVPAIPVVVMHEDHHAHAYATPPSPREIYSVLQNLKAAEGSSSDAEAGLELLKSSRRPYESLTSVADTYLSLLRAEGSSSTSDAMSDFRMIHNSLRPGESREDATQAFLGLLRAEGSSSTSDAQAGYNMISNSLRPGENRNAATNTYLSLLRAEGSSSTSDAMSDYQLINSSIRPGQTRGEATDFFLDVLRSKGSSNTSGAQHEFRLYQ